VISVRLVLIKIKLVLLRVNHAQLPLLQAWHLARQTVLALVANIALVDVLEHLQLPLYAQPAVALVGNMALVDVLEQLTMYVQVAVQTIASNRVITIPAHYAVGLITVVEPALLVLPERTNLLHAAPQPILFAKPAVLVLLESTRLWHAAPQTLLDAQPAPVAHTVNVR